jgi:ribose 5-phosphate isomerase A
LNPKHEQMEAEKKKAALKAVENVKEGFVVGLGSGSTAAYAIEKIGNKVRHEGLNVLGVPTSYQAFMLAIKYSIPITTLEEHPRLDLAIDGADQIDNDLNLIKGMGGALLREKIVASTAKRFIVIADESKKVKILGENNHPIPLEVIPFAAKPVMLKLKEMSGTAILREDKGKVGPVITDNGNAIIDANFGPIESPSKLESALTRLPGIVETGLFLEMADVAYIGTTSGVETIQRKSR